MKAIEIQGSGVSAQLHLTERSQPIPAQGEVLIRVVAAGVNRPDLLQRIGKYPPPPGITDIPGLEVAGDIIESKDANWQPGDKVCALLSGGGYAEYAVAPGGQCLPLPTTLSLIEAAGLPETVFTVWNNVFMRGKLKSGETLLIHGGSSGIGTTAIQMAKAHGARVIVTAGSDEKCAACIMLGADQAINYKTHDFAAEINNGVDVVLDMVGGDYIPRSLRIMNTDGRHVSIAHMQSAKAEIDIRALMQKRIILTGSTLRPRSIEEKAELAQGIRETVWPWIAQRKFRPFIYATYPLTEAQRAQEDLESGQSVGKIILTVP